MALLPLNIEMQGRRAIVAGGGPVAERKVRRLLECGAEVRLVSPAATAGLERLAQEGRIVWLRGSYSDAELAGAFLAVAATDDADVNHGVAEDARKRGILVLVADAPELGDCHFPAVLRQGDLQVAVSSGGRCPAFAALVRNHIAAAIGPAYGEALEQLAAEREKQLTEGNGSTYNNKIFRSVAERLIAELSEHKEGT